MAGDLLIFYLFFTYFLLTFCWRFAGDFLEICWRFAGDLLMTCWRFAGDFAGVLLEICLPDFCWRFAGNLLLKVAGDLMRKDGEDDGSHFVLIVH